jgi:hypothetical protein
VDESRTKHQRRYKPKNDNPEIAKRLSFKCHSDFVGNCKRSGAPNLPQRSDNHIGINVEKLKLGADTDQRKNKEPKMKLYGKRSMSVKNVVGSSDTFSLFLSPLAG